mgnify:CR=1 FL=1
MLSDTRLFFKLVLLSLLMSFLMILLAGSAQASSRLDPSQVQGLSQTSFAAKKQAIELLASQQDPVAAQLLQALQQGQLYTASPDLLLIKQGDSYFNPFTQQAETNQELPTKTIVLNNNLRRLVANALAQFDILSSDLSTRQSAVTKLLSQAKQVPLDLVRTALSQETDPELSQQLRTLEAFALLHSDPQQSSHEQQLAAIASLQATNHPQALATLFEFKQTPGLAEPLQAAADEAIASIEQQQAYAKLANHIFSGLSLGSILLLAALGLAVIYGLIGVINMAHGEFLMLGAYATYLTQNFFQAYLPAYQDYYLLLALPVAFILTALIGLLIEWLIIRHLYGRPLESLLATFGLSLVLMQAVRMTFGAQNVEVANPSWLSGSFAPFAQSLPDFVVPYNRLIILAFSLCVVLALYLVLNKTRLGLFIRAVTQNRTMASCVGIKTRRVDAYAFALGAGIAGLGGVALSQIGNVGPDLGQAYIIDSFMAVVLGGVGQLIGTVLGAFGLGIISKLGEPLLGAVLIKILILLLVIIFIQKRPQGLFALKGRSAEA